MKIHISSTPLPDLVIIDIQPFTDERGFFIEPWNKRDFESAGIFCDFVQEGHSRSSKGVVRGLHYQNMQTPMAKLVRCTLGEIFDVAVDLRMKSPSFGKWFGIPLSAENKKTMLIPVGFAHGFMTMSSYAEVQYKQTGYYAPGTEGTLLWNDKDVAIGWPSMNDVVLSDRDKRGKTLKEYIQSPSFI